MSTAVNQDSEEAPGGYEDEDDKQIAIASVWH